MDISRFLSTCRETISERGLSGFREVLYLLYQGAWSNVGQVYNYGTNVYECEWDVLVVLDACRVDTLEEIAAEYEFVGAIDSTYSVGSASAEWMQKTFDESYREEIRQTVYVTGNPHSEDILQPDKFRILDEVWRYRWDDELGTVLPRSVTNQAIKHYRMEEPKRMILHYMQPHFPSVPVPELESGMNPGTSGWESIWDELRTGRVSQEAVEEAYTANLNYVMEELQVLTQNIAADSVVLTSDHANLFGDLSLYGHPSYVPLRTLKRVPWVELETSDETTFIPDDYESSAQEVTKEKLSALGYR